MILLNFSKVHYEKPITSKFFTKDDVVEKNIPEDVEENKMDLSEIPELKLVKQSEDEKVYFFSLKIL